MSASDLEGAAAEEQGETRALLLVEHSVGALEGLDHGVLDAFCALSASVGGGLDGGLIKGVALEGVGKGGDGASVVYARLSTLGLQVIDDDGELGHLIVVEIELSGHESEWASHTKAASSAAVTAAHLAASPAMARAVVMGVIGVRSVAAGKGGVPSKKSTEHVFS